MLVQKDGCKQNGLTKQQKLLADKFPSALFLPKMKSRRREFMEGIRFSQVFKIRKLMDFPAL